MTQKKIIVIGAGAAGLMAAGTAAEKGARVIILEKMRKPAMKLRITGKGRCNITNIAELPEFISHFGKTGRFLRTAFNHFFNTELLEFLQTLGLKVVKERGGRVFPESGKATEVVEILLEWVKKNKVKIRLNSSVERLIIKDGYIQGVFSNGNEIKCDAVIMATGGSSYPLTGSTGDGYVLAETAGHKIVPLRPALVPLETGGKHAGAMNKLNLRNVNVSVYLGGKKKKEAFGELVFSEFGVTGPVILTLSGLIVDALMDGLEVEISLDLKPALDEQKMDARLLRDFDARKKESIGSILGGLLPREMIPVCLEITSIPENRIGAEVTAKERKRLKSWLKDFRLKVTNYRSMDEAIVTAGGVSLKEVDPNTMESKNVKGLYIVGELLDIQADTGGYNLQGAFSTGYLAGKSVVHEPVN